MNQGQSGSGGSGQGDRPAATGDTGAKKAADQKDHYLAYLGSKKAPDSEIAEKDYLKVGDWRFFFESSKRVMVNRPAAVNSAGLVLAPKDQKENPWHAFLTTEGLDAKGALKRITWLYMSMPLSSEEKPTRKAEVLAVVKDPTLERNPDGSVRFQGFTVTPPHINEAYRLTITAPPGGPAAVEFKNWQEVAKEGQ